MKLHLLVIALLGVPDGQTVEAEVAAPPIEVKSGVAQLFVDDFLISAQAGLKRTLHQPTKDNDGNVPVLAFDKEYGDYRSTLEANGTVIFDTRLKKYVMFGIGFSSHFPGPPSERQLSCDKTGTVFLPTRMPRTFEFDYDPAENKGVGRVTVKLDGEKPILLDLKPGQRKAGATFDRFGLMSFRRGGKFSVLYFDDLTYTTRRAEPAPRHEQKITTVPFPK